MNRFIGVLLLVFIVSGAVAQNTRSTDTPKPPRPTYQAKKKEKKGVFTFLKKKEKNQGRDEVAEFRSRLQKVYKEKAKEERLADKKRYKDPTYFGHKKPPKKRPVGKQKFCKVCKIKH
ncbi:MAG: hypothetical protein ABJP45_11045 [Cyclobacteriaceae bacterium]